MERYAVGQRVKVIDSDIPRYYETEGEIDIAYDDGGGYDYRVRHFDGRRLHWDHHELEAIDATVAPSKLALSHTEDGVEFDDTPEVVTPKNKHLFAWLSGRRLTIKRNTKTRSYDLSSDYYVSVSSRLRLQTLLSKYPHSVELSFDLDPTVYFYTLP